MKKLTFTLSVFCMLSLATQPVFSATTTNQRFNDRSKTGKNKNALSIGSNRATGDLQLHFTADKAGKASILVLNESGEIMLHQTDELTDCINTIPLKNATELTGGSYVVRLTLNDITYTANFLIWK